MRCVPYIIDGLDPLRHLAVENALLDRLTASVPLLLFYVNGPSVIIGRNQNPWREIASSSTAAWCRRASGGGAVYHDEGNLNWSFIVSRDTHDQDAELASIARGVSSCGTKVSPGLRGGIFCDASTGHGGKKISGTARRFGRSSVIHHGTVLVSTDLDRMRECLGGIETFDDLGIASVHASPVNLAALVPGVSVIDVIDALSRSVAGTPASPWPPGMVDAARLAIEEEVLDSAGWKIGLTPRFSARMQCGTETLVVDVKAGIVESIALSADGARSTADSPIRDAMAGFTGKPFSYILGQEIESAIASSGFPP
jgi:lipoate-protein ligase A